MPPSARAGMVHPTLPAGGSLTIGYGSSGSGPRCYGLAKGQTVDVGFIKVFITTEYVDFSDIEQASPFQTNRVNTSDRRRKRWVRWDTKTIPIIQK